MFDGFEGEKLGKPTTRNAPFINIKHKHQQAKHRTPPKRAHSLNHTYVNPRTHIHTTASQMSAAQAATQPAGAEAGAVKDDGAMEIDDAALHVNDGGDDDDDAAAAADTANEEFVDDTVLNPLKAKSITLASRKNCTHYVAMPDDAAKVAAYSWTEGDDGDSSGDVVGGGGGATGGDTKQISGEADAACCAAAAADAKSGTVTDANEHGLCGHCGGVG
jgi:hypothetical protein